MSQAGDSERLAVFRRVAAGLHPYVEEHLSHRFSVRMGGPDDSGATLLPDATIDAMAVRVRNAYAQREASHFPSICKAVQRIGADFESRLAVVARKGWTRIVNGRIVFSHGSESYSSHDLLDAYLYGELTHSHEHQYQNLVAIRRFGEFAEMALQGTIVRMCHAVICLDSVVASVVGEEPLPCGPLLPIRLQDVLAAERAR
jgi:hypothetical protein